MGNPEYADLFSLLATPEPVGSQKIVHLSLERASTSPGLADAIEVSPSEEELP